VCVFVCVCVCVCVCEYSDRCTNIHMHILEMHTIDMHKDISVQTLDMHKDISVQTLAIRTNVYFNRVLTDRLNFYVCLHVYFMHV